MPGFAIICSENMWQKLDERRRSTTCRFFKFLAVNGYKFADRQNIEDLFREYVTWKGWL
jgi:hypothetical protein